MKEEIFSRETLLVGTEVMKAIAAKNVIIFGVGGVGSWCAESLVRSGIKHLTIVDSDVVCVTNVNRQLMATTKTIGRVKVDVLKERLLDINPLAQINAIQGVYNEETSASFNLCSYDYIIDAIDTVTSKLLLIEKAKEYNVPIISCMGTGGKTNPSLFEVTDIKKTHTCPLAKVMRKELKERGINSLKVVFSPEQPVKANDIIPSISFVPSSAGLLIASEVIKDLIK